MQALMDPHGCGGKRRLLVYRGRQEFGSLPTILRYFQLFWAGLGEVRANISLLCAKVVQIPYIGARLYPLK